MKLCIRAHDLGVKGTKSILEQLRKLQIDGVQMVCYKAYDDIAYVPGSITWDKAEQIGQAFQENGSIIPMVGAYFNPVHSSETKRENSFRIFADYLKCCKAMGCDVVGSETGSYNDEPWIYHPKNRTEEGLRAVAETFSGLCDIAAEFGSTVAVEGSAGHVCWSVDALARMRQMIGKPTKVIFDLYNYLDASNQRDYLNILDQGLDTFAGEIHLFHIKDCDFCDGMDPKQVPFGTGRMDLDAVLGRIKAYDKDAVLTLEGTTGEHIAHAVTTLKTIWERV